MKIYTNSNAQSKTLKSDSIWMNIGKGYILFLWCCDTQFQWTAEDFKCQTGLDGEWMHPSDQHVKVDEWEQE